MKQKTKTPEQKRRALERSIKKFGDYDSSKSKKLARMESGKATK